MARHMTLAVRYSERIAVTLLFAAVPCLFPNLDVPPLDSHPNSSTRWCYLEWQNSYWIRDPTLVGPLGLTHRKCNAGLGTAEPEGRCSGGEICTLLCSNGEFFFHIGWEIANGGMDL